MESYSHTRLELFEACPGAYYDKYEAKIPEPPSEPLETGKLIHEIIATYNKHCLGKGVTSDVTAVEGIAREIFFGKPTPLHPSKLTEILRLAENYATGHLIDINTTVGFEEKVLLFRETESDKWVSVDSSLSDRDESFRKMSGDRFLGVIDDLAIQEITATVTDYKSNWEIASQSSVDTNPQLDRYAWLVAMEYPQIQKIIVKLDFVRWKVIRERKYPLTRDQALAVEQDVNARIAQIKEARCNNEWPRWPGHHCGWCPRVITCAEALKFAETLTVTNQEDAERLFGDIILLDGHNKARKKQLRGYCEACNGVVVKNGMEIGFKKTESWGIPPEKYVEAFAILTKHGEDPWDYLKFSKTGLKPLLYRPGLGEELRQLVVDESSTKFGISKVKGDDD